MKRAIFIKTEGSETDKIKNKESGTWGAFLQQTFRGRKECFE